MEPLDETLLAGMAAGDQQAAATFVRRYQGRVIGLAMTLVGDAATSEEVAQETFLRVWRHAGAYDARRGRVATWVLAIARNLAIDQLRLRRAKPIDPQRLALLDAEVLGVVRGHGADDPGEVGRIRDALAELPAEQRRALLLAALCGLTAREIGEVEQAPVGTAKTRIRAAMQKLRVTLEAADER
jgi:RNA polymerase sigma-70 factor (ECF subfamily)